MGNLLRIVASAVEHWPAYLIPWQTNKNIQKKTCTNENAENVVTLGKDELQRLLGEKEEELNILRMDNDHLRTRLSDMGTVLLTEGNPNITDLSDQNRPDKIAEQFSELYDNQWTDCYQVLVDPLSKSEQETVETLLTILKTAYDISLNRSQEIMRDARRVLLALAGKSDGEPEKALDSLIQETLHKMKSYRTKHFKAVPRDIAKEINEKLIETIGQQGVTACSEYIEECVRICWLMCIKDPPMYIFCEKEDVFNKNHFMEYTEIGHKVSYVVWPVLYLYKDGPLMRKGVAQGEGEGKQTEDCKVNAAEDGSPKFDDSVEKKPQLSTRTKEMDQPNEDDHPETELSEINENKLESMPIIVSPNTLEDIYVEEHVIGQQVGTKDINATVAEGNSSTGPSNEDVGIDMQLLTLTGHKAGAGQPIPDDICFIEEHGQDIIKENQEEETEMTDADGTQNVEDKESCDKHVANLLMGVLTSVNNSPTEEHEHELSNPCGSNSNNSPDSNNHGDDSTLEVEQKYLVQTSIASSEKIEEENGGKQGDAVMIIHDNEMELGKKTNKIFLLENETRTVDHVMDIDALHSLDKKGEETEDDIVSPSNDKDRPEVYVKEENLGVGDVCSLSESIGPGEKSDDYNRDLAVATDDGVAKPIVAPPNEKHHQGNLSEDSSVEGQGEI